MKPIIRAAVHGDIERIYERIVCAGRLAQANRA